jgi:Na+/H+ antiporter NhaD/arsenite permease-like protein
MVLIVFLAVYGGLILGEIPGLRLDRAGIAILGAIALVALGATTTTRAWAMVDVNTIALLFGLMIVSAQFRLFGFYTWVSARLARGRQTPGQLLALVVALAGVLSALLANDIVCLALAPLLVELARKKSLDPMPFLLGLACAANVGSAATLIGNPQNMLIGQALKLSFGRYLLDGGVPALLGLVLVWAVLARMWRGRWAGAAAGSRPEGEPFNRWQTLKAALVLAGVIAAFLFGPWPHGAVALAGAGLLLTSRHMASREVLGLVDWQLLVMFMGLFVVNGALQEAGYSARGLHQLSASGLDLRSPLVLFGVTALLSNLVSNVPAVMLLLPAASHPSAGPILALASTFAGNFIIVGSIANIIVVDQANRHGVRIDWRTHARVGIPVTLGTLVLAGAWLGIRAQWPGPSPQLSLPSSAR